LALIVAVAALAMLSGGIAQNGRMPWAAWLRGIDVTLAAVLGALFGLFFCRRRLASPRRAAEGRRSGGGEAVVVAPAPEEIRTFSECLHALMFEVGEDRSSLECRRSQLFQAERLALAGKLATSMAHEIRSPLTAIKMWLFAIRTAVAPNAELSRKFDIVSEEIARLESMVRNFLEFPRPAATTLRPQSISEVIDKTLELALHQIRQSRLHFLYDKPVGLPQVLADPQRLEQVFLNLLNNAVEATAEGRELRLLTAVERDSGGGEYVVVRVQDTGPGIPEEARARIFEPFYTTKENGTGLGLYIAAQIMAQVGGKLVLERSNPDGTSFAVWVPAARMENHEQDPCR
jgi:signal transduction histidine kinase